MLFWVPCPCETPGVARCCSFPGISKIGVWSLAKRGTGLQVSHLVSGAASTSVEKLVFPVLSSTDDRQMKHGSLGSACSIRRNVYVAGK